MFEHNIRKMIEIIPALMPSSFQDMEDTLALVAPYVPLVQLDIMDGKFVRPRTWPYFSDHASFEALLVEDAGFPFWERLNFEIDLMVTKPEDVIDDWISAGASRIIIHVESTKNIPVIVANLNTRLKYSKDHGVPRDVELGIALNVDTPTETITEFLEDIDFVQFMGIKNIGYQGEQLDESVFNKIRTFHDAHPEVIISVDGGVTLDNARDLTELGVKRLVSGSAILKSNSIPATLEEFKNI